MSPSHIHDHEQSRREMNGPRPSPLKINKDSHVKHKTTSSSSTSSLPATATLQQRHPVIIYTHSPKIIHTQARDFMALVQKLTGLAPSHEQATPVQQRQVSDGGKPMRSEKLLLEEKDGAKVSSSPVSPIFRSPNPFFAEIPLFTPNSSDFFCSPKPLYRYQDSVLASQYGELDL